jgi:hypothetical protein
MNAIEVQVHAQKLYAAHGPKALAEATDKIRSLQKSGDEEQLQDWRKIEAALRNLQRPIAS